jgi:NAD(P)-dependent dehydrogenase (short-subunit alcohol dehydrogenase family)
MRTTTSSLGVALVTGAAKRLGQQIALALAQAGWDIAVHYRHSASEAQSTAARIQALGRRAQAFAADLSDPNAADRLFDQVVAALGPVNCLVNSASRFELDQPHSFSAERFEQHLAPNLTAPLLLSRRLYEAVKARPLPPAATPAVIINLLDQKLENLNPDFFSYTLTKAALLAATRMMAIAFAPQVRVNGVSPGATLVSWAQSQQGFEEANRIALLNHSSTPNDIAQAVVYLASAGAVTGVNLIVDGGQHLMPLNRDVMFLTKNPP